MRSFQQNLDKLAARGVRLVAISVDPPAVTRQHAEKQGYTFTFLSDEKAEVIRRYGLIHQKGGPGEKDIARPAEFLLDAAGTVRWVNLTEDYRVRARPEEVLRVIDSLAAAEWRP